LDSLGNSSSSLGNTRSIHANDPANDPGASSLKDTNTKTDANAPSRKDTETKTDTNNSTGGVLSKVPLGLLGNRRSVHANDPVNDPGASSLKDTNTKTDASNSTPNADGVARTDSKPDHNEKTNDTFDVASETGRGLD